MLIFNYLTAHAALPNPSNEIRMSLDVRAIPTWESELGKIAYVGAHVMAMTRKDGTVAVLRPNFY